MDRVYRRTMYVCIVLKDNFVSDLCVAHHVLHIEPFTLEWIREQGGPRPCVRFKRVLLNSSAISTNAVRPMTTRTSMVPSDPFMV